MGKNFYHLSSQAAYFYYISNFVWFCVAADVYFPARFSGTSALETFLLTFLSLSYILCGTAYRCLQLNAGK